MESRSCISVILLAWNRDSLLMPVISRERDWGKRCRNRGREGDRQTDRQTGRQADRQRERETDRNRDREKDRLADRHRHRETEPVSF